MRADTAGRAQPAAAPPDTPPTPRPGQPVRGSDTGRPLSALFDLLGRRWAMSVLWSLDRGPLTFRALQAQIGPIATSVLNTRLRELRDVGLADSTPAGYVLTDTGQELLVAGAPLIAWADRWAADLGEPPA